MTRAYRPSPSLFVRTYVKPGFKPITAAFGEDGSKVLLKLGYKEEGMAKGTKAPKEKSKNTNRADRKELAALLQKHLKETRPDITLGEMRKVAGVLYVGLSKQIKSRS